MTATKTCAIYLRVSTNDGRQTVENQRAEVMALVAGRGFDLVESYEEAASAMKARPVFDRMRQDARRGRFKVVVVWSLDRLGRGFACFDTFRELAQIGVTVVSVREPWTEADGPARELLVSVMSWVSGFERQRLVERTKAGVERARRDGKRIGRPATSLVLLHAAAELVANGATISAAAREKGVDRSVLSRFVCRKGVPEAA
jgi:DNA invertase Pin-like site-specific DNA recombinase